MYRNEGVSQGGLFHVKRVQYSPETQRLLKELINESKLSMSYRRLVNDSIAKGDPLPLPPQTPRSMPEMTNESESIRTIYLPRRRKREQIVRSGAYDRDDDLARRAPVDYEQEKRRLQDLMAFGKTIKKSVFKKPAVEPKESEQQEKGWEKISWILKEIEEREHFLNDMRKLGKGKEYEGIIKQEIAAKLRSLEEMDADLKNILKADYKEMQDYKAATSTFSA